MRRLFPFIVTGVALLTLVSCASARRGEPIKGPMKISSPEAQKGRHVFERHCSQCHPGGEAGLGPALNNKPLPVFLMKLQVRRGIGVMPSFSKEHISDEELDNLMEYIKGLRRHG